METNRKTRESRVRINIGRGFSGLIEKNVQIFGDWNGETLKFESKRS